ncbi:MAG: DUF4399 domain-containing protein [Gammaproteobacteria bacterium]|nr:DUF4399 domain-containing protein [Gammaproteobacteria bacterium]
MNRILPIALLSLGLVACGQQKPGTPADAPAATAPAPAPAAALPRTPSPAGASVAIVSPADGDVVTSPFRVSFAAEGMSVVPAGDFTPDSGHHHLLIDTGLPADLSQPLPKDGQHLHFGLGQTETEVTLPPGQHTLQLLLGDGNHVPHDPPVLSAPITITVQ